MKIQDIKKTYLNQFIFRGKGIPSSFIKEAMNDVTFNQMTTDLERFNFESLR